MKSDDEDIKLISEIANNNYLSYNKLFHHYYNPLCRYVYNMIHNKNDAEDIIQELFLNLWKNRSRLEIQSNVTIYLYKTAKNLTLNYIRDNQKYDMISDYSELPELSTEDNSIEAEEFRRILSDCIDRLPQRNKEILLMHRLKGFKQKEIAEKLDISVKTIKNQIWIALQRLKNCLSLKEI